MPLALPCTCAGPIPSPPPPPRPPSPTPPSPPPPTPENRFYPLVADAATIAYANFDSVCGLAGKVLTQALPLRMHLDGEEGPASLQAGWRLGEGLSLLRSILSGTGSMPR